MKRLVAAALAIACAASLTACSTRQKDTGSSSSLAATPTPTTSAASSLPSSSSSHSSSGPVSGLESGMESMEDKIESGVSDLASGARSAVTPAMSADLEIGAMGAGEVKWGPGTRRDEETNRTTDAEALQERYGKYGAYFIAPADCGKFYLTFDEGYENGYTPKILDTLKEKGVSAVFFVTMPFVKSCPDLIRRMIDEGHVVGNHTNHHWNPTQKTLEQARQDIQELHDYMLENFNYTMTLYRPPQGSFSEQTLALARQMGYTTVLWSFAYSDWDPDNQPGEAVALRRTTDYIHEGAIYLLHAVSRDNAAILGELIDEIRGRGLTICRWDLAGPESPG